MYIPLSRILAIMISATLLTTALTAIELPRPLLCGYSGFQLGKNMERIDWTYETMQACGFNAVQMKVLPPTRRALQLNKHLDYFRTVCEKATAHDLALLLYVYPIPSNAERHEDWAEHKDMPFVVDAEGRPARNTMRINDVRVWRQIFANARELAEASKTIPFAALEFDIECIAKQFSYDDDTWKAFCRTAPEYAAAIPADQRAAELASRNDTARYHAFFFDQVEDAVRQWLDELHEINPKLSLGFMPARPANDRMTQIFERHLATATAPAVIDGWDMYNGSGFSDAVVAHQKSVKANHPNNRFICWFRVNSYAPEDMRAMAYHTAAHVDGYSMWDYLMLCDKEKLPIYYKLPAGHAAQEYLDALKDANMAIREDIKAGTLANPTRIPMKAPKPLVAPLAYDDVAMTQYQPDGTGEGAPTQMVLRDRQIIRIWAKAGEKLSVKLAHLAGAARPLALHYVLLAPDRKELRHESISPAASEHFEVDAPVTGCYALVVAGGLGGQAWYGVTVYNRHYGVDCAKEAYFFRPQSIFVPGPQFGNSCMKIDTTHDLQSYIYRLDDGQPVKRARLQLTEIPLARPVTKVTFEKYEPEGTYTQDFMVSFPKGALHLAFGAAETRLK